MVGKRGYHDGCALAHGLELIGERWALLIVRELVFGPKRFTDLHADLPGVSADVLSQRLKELQSTGVVERHKLAPPASIWVYGLTEWGAQLEPAIISLARWASLSPNLPLDAPISAASLVLELKTRFDPEAAAGFKAIIGLRLGSYDFRIRVAGGHLEATSGPTRDADATLTTDTETLASIFHGGLTTAKAQKAGQLQLSGDVAVAKQFTALFPNP